MDVVDFLGRCEISRKLKCLYLLLLLIKARGLHAEVVATGLCLQEFARLVTGKRVHAFGEDLFGLDGRAGRRLQQHVDVAVVGPHCVQGGMFVAHYPSVYVH